jgi:hypothetical protein
MPLNQEGKKERFAYISAPLDEDAQKVVVTNSILRLQGVVP